MKSVQAVDGFLSHQGYVGHSGQRPSFACAPLLSAVAGGQLRAVAGVNGAHPLRDHTRRTGNLHEDTNTPPPNLIERVRETRLAPGTERRRSRRWRDAGVRRLCRDEAERCGSWTVAVAAAISASDGDGEHQDEGGERELHPGIGVAARHGRLPQKRIGVRQTVGVSGPAISQSSPTTTMPPGVAVGRLAGSSPPSPHPASPRMSAIVRQPSLNAMGRSLPMRAAHRQWKPPARATRT